MADDLNRFNFVLPDALAAEIDRYRKDVGTLPPKAVAVRELIQLGLQTYWDKKEKQERES